MKFLMSGCVTTQERWVKSMTKTLANMTDPHDYPIFIAPVPIEQEDEVV